VNFQTACRALCQQILEHFATALGIKCDWFSSRHDETQGPSGTVFRLLYYPQLDNHNAAGEDIRAGAHSDYGSITLLFQQIGQPGLEIKTPSGEWKAVPVDPLFHGTGGPTPLPILVNIGDLLQDWTGGLLKSTVHRVIFPVEEGLRGDRYSMAYFCHPLDDALLEAVPSELVREHSAGRLGGKADGRVITAKDHVMRRLAATYDVS